MSTQSHSSPVECPVCCRKFSNDAIAEHVNKCLFLNTHNELTICNKRSSSSVCSASPRDKRMKMGTSESTGEKSNINHTIQEPPSNKSGTKKDLTNKSNVPLAEKMRPVHLDELVGQTEAFGAGSMLRSLLEQKQIPNMILWGPPGCGKTSLANVIATICKEQNNLRFVKLSATMSGINDVKEVVKVAKNENQFKRQTVLFMDEIHRFNKLQQDTFLPHVESGTIILVGATTENPSFSLNNALLSRCRVVVMNKLSVEDVMVILERSLTKGNDVIIVDSQKESKYGLKEDVIPKWIVDIASLKWLAEICDGDARVALGALELALSAQAPVDVLVEGPPVLSLKQIQDGIKRSHMLYDRCGEEHYNTVSALHKSVRAGDDNAALYWCARALHSGEDPRYIARRLVRAAAEDIGLADPSTLVEAVACHQGCQQIGSPECDVLLAQCAVRLARAPKSTEVYHALGRVKRSLQEAKGPLPSVPLHLRNAPTKLMKQLGYGRGYNTLSYEESGLTYMPEGMENVNFFDTSNSYNDN